MIELKIIEKEFGGFTTEVKLIGREIPVIVECDRHGFGAKPENIIAILNMCNIAYSTKEERLIKNKKG